MRRSVSRHERTFSQLATAAIPGLFALMLLSTAGMSQSVPSRAPSVALTDELPKLDLAIERTIALNPLNLGQLGTFAVSKNGQIVLVDDYDRRIIILSAAGKIERSLGRRGNGPGEYLELSSLGWLDDTLVVLDTKLRRLTFILTTDGRVAKTLPIDPRAGAPVGLYTSGAKLYITIVSASRRVPIGNKGVHVYPTKGLAEVNGSGFVFGSPISDESIDYHGSDCEDQKGVMHILSPIFDLRGPFRAVSSGGDLLVGSPFEFEIARHSAKAASVVTLQGTTAFRPVSANTWDSVTSEFSAIRKRSGELKCYPAFKPAAKMPVLQALAVDDKDRMWLELNTDARNRIAGYSLVGVPYGEFLLPANNPKLPWLIRNDKFYYLSKGEFEPMLVVSRIVR